MQTTHVQTYVTYRFRDKDPMIDQLRTACQEAYPGGDRHRKIDYADISEKSGVSVSTLYNWFEGETRRPQFASMCAVARACDYDLVLVRKKKTH